MWSDSYPYLLEYWNYMWMEEIAYIHSLFNFELFIKDLFLHYLKSHKISDL